MMILRTCFDTFQVSTQQTELGIGQTSFSDYRYSFVDFMPAMYKGGTIMASQRPKEITSYDTIVIPFDKYVWFFTLGCIITQFLLLGMMQIIWSSVTGTRRPRDFVFEGLVTN